jgi:transposase
MNNHTSRRTFSEEFKLQMVQLYNSGKSKTSISREYDISTNVLDRWIKRINATGSSKESDNRTPEQIELLHLRKENHRLQMENDILKQAALIFAQKSK